ncbi:uncharacterized protein LOC142525667 isoform X3 [Primulina tabacum]|uniref:uncharacterized protein LOC142525667 isoform X3 n=1 Tax=Primulina tabacum TaxID=48773 RepID=UPI003F5ADC0A
MSSPLSAGNGIKTRDSNNCRGNCLSSSQGLSSTREMRTRIPETVSWDYNFGTAGNTPMSFTAPALKEAIDDLEWSGSNIQINLMSSPQSVAFRGEGLGDLQIDINYYAYTDLLIAFSCDRQISHRFFSLTISS